VEDTSESKVVLADSDEALALAGSRDENLRLIEEVVPVHKRMQRAQSTLPLPLFR
jgi:phosphate starvation-inducible protein PhoH